MKVVFFHRRPRSDYNFSIESLFVEIRNALPSRIDQELKVLRYFSNGLFKRLYIALEAAFHQGDVNHITGDVNFVAIFLRRKRTVLTIHDIGFMEHPSAISRLLLKWMWIILPVKRSHTIVCVSEATRRELLKYVPSYASKIKVIHVVISSSFTRYDKPFNKTAPRILQIGTVFNKNMSRLIKALEGIPCTLEIVGGLNETLIRELEQSRIMFVSSKNLTESELLDKYRSADILTFISTYEGFGMPIVEANAIGRAVVTSNVLSMPEVAGDAAHLVDPYSVESIRNGILKVIQDDGYRNKLIENGYLNCQRFDVKNIADQYARIYDEIYERYGSLRK